MQSFPEFKAERRGAPISAFLRWDDQPIRRRYKLHDCDVLVVVSPGPPAPELLQLVRAGGLVVCNRDSRLRLAGPFDIVRVDASRIARRCDVLSAEGRPMGNTALLGACIRQLLPDGLPFLEDAIRDRMGSRAPANVEAARAGFARCVRQHVLFEDERLPHNGPTSARAPAGSLFPVGAQDSRIVHTGSWSLERPVILEACTACAVCALFCPEGAIVRDGAKISVDYLYCKGCGICEVVCPVRGALAMEEVRA